MDRDDGRRPAQQGHHALGIFAPQDRHQRTLPPRAVSAVGNRGNRRRRDGLPPFAAVRAGVSRFDTEDAVQEQDALIRPSAEVAVDAGRESEVVVEFAVDVGEASRDGPSRAGDGEGQPDGVSRGGVGVLAENQDFDVGQRLFEGAQEVPCSRQNLGAVGRLARDIVQCLTELSFNRAQCIGPIGSHQLLQRLFEQGGEALVSSIGRFEIKECIHASHHAIVSRAVRACE